MRKKAASRLKKSVLKKKVIQALPLKRALVKPKKAIAAAAPKKIEAPRRIETPVRLALPKPVQSLWQIRSLIVWSVLFVSVLAVLAMAASYADRGERKKSQFAEKISQTSVMTADEQNDDEKITILATGDILPARYVEKKMRQLKDYTFPFQKVCDTLKQADITFGNLESPLMPGANVPTGSMTFRGDSEAVKGLQCAGYDVLSVANNHMMNYQVPGLTSTLQTLRKAGIQFAGAGKNLDAAHTPAIIQVKGKKVAFYAYNDKTIPPGFHGEAKANVPGIAKPGIAKMDVETVQADVKCALSPDCWGADIVIVSMHAGTEYTHVPTKIQQDFAHAAIDAGASAVIGTHPHVVQPVEQYKNGVIFYSLGNFVFDQFFSEDVKTGLVAKLVFEDGAAPSFELFPVKIENTQPRILEGEEREKTLVKLGLSSIQ